MKRIVIKIGSRVLTKPNGLLDDEVIQRLVKDVHDIRRDFNVETILVSSGAVASGRGVLDTAQFSINTQSLKYDREILKEQILASIGQVELISSYKREFYKYHMLCSQILATRKDFAGRDEYLSLKTVVENLLNLGICPIFNENDVLSPEELDFSDNDQLAYMVAAMVCADHLIILTNVDGVFDGVPGQPGVRVIPEIDDVSKYIDLADDSHSKGKGGMRSKLLSADLITSLGIPMHIANGMCSNVIYRIMSEEKIGTFFPSQHQKKKALKTWLATAAAGSGRIIVSTYLADMLRKKHPASILFSGIDAVDGQFNVRDAVDVCDDKGNILGRGIVKYSSEDLKMRIQKFIEVSQTGGRMKSNDIIAIHYDYLVFM